MLKPHYRYPANTRVPSSQAEKLLHAMERHAAVCGDLGMSLFRVGKAEEAEGGPLAEHTATVGRGGWVRVRVG